MGPLAGVLWAWVAEMVVVLLVVVVVPVAEGPVCGTHHVVLLLLQVVVVVRMVLVLVLLVLVLVLVLVLMLVLVVGRRRMGGHGMAGGLRIGGGGQGHRMLRSGAMGK